MSLFVHIDMNNFYASVECRVNPSIADKPVAVAGSPEKRHGVVLAKNEIAKKLGVKTGDTVSEASAKAPGIVFVPPRFDVYDKISKRMFGICNRYSYCVEPFGPDECWLDCTGSQKLFGDGKTIADNIRMTVKRETGLTVSVGVSFNKVFAKLGSDLKKPDATTVITRGNFRQKIWPLPVSDLIMVGRKTAAALQKLNILTIGDLAAADTATLKAHFGKNGEKLQSYALGQDAEPVREYTQSRAPESIGHGMTATRDLQSYQEADILIAYLSEKIAHRMRKAGVRGSGVHLDLRSSSLSHVSKQTLLKSAVCSGRDIERVASSLMRQIWHEEYPLRTISVSVFDLVDEQKGTQISLFDDDKRRKNESLERAIDKIRGKYGADTIMRAGLIANDFIYDKNDDEDFLPFKR